MGKLYSKNMRKPAIAEAMTCEAIRTILTATNFIKLNINEQQRFTNK